VTLQPGTSARVALSLDRRAFAFWHTPRAAWVVEGGTFGVHVGASSRDIRLRAEISLPGDELTAPLRAEATADAWLAHPAAGPWLRQSLGDGEFARLMFDPHNGQMLRAIPVQRLARMPGFPVTEDQVLQAVSRFSRGN
jgi:beta-glucosidase